MPYWTPERIKKAMRRNPWQFFVGVPAFVEITHQFLMNSVEKIDLTEIPTNEMIKVMISNLGLNFIEHLKNLSNGRCIFPQFPVDDALGPDMYKKKRASKRFYEIASSYYSSVLLHQQIGTFGVKHYFIEEKIADAFSKASLKDLKFCDLPQSETVIVGHFPPSAVTDDLTITEMALSPIIVVNGIAQCFSTAHFQYNIKPYLKKLKVKEVEAKFKFNKDQKVYTVDELAAFIAGWPGSSILINMVNGGLSESLGDIHDDEFKRLFNLLMYCKSDNPDIVRQLNPDFHKTKKRKSGKNKKRKKSAKTSSTNANNHQFIVGQNIEVIQRRKSAFEPKETPDEKSEPTGKHRANHEVRGHWRWQACGPKYSKHKLIFINPYRAGKNPPKEKVFNVRS